MKMPSDDVTVLWAAIIIVAFGFLIYLIVKGNG